MRNNKKLPLFGLLFSVLISGSAFAQLAPQTQHKKTTHTSEQITSLVVEEKGLSRHSLGSDSYVSKQIIENVVINEDVSQKGTAIIYFDFDSYTMPYRAKKVLDDFVSKAPYGTSFRVEATADFIGGKQYNQLLSQRRADTIANYILQKEGATVSGTIGLGQKEAKKRRFCKDKNLSALEACAAPDRFAVITYTSTN